MSLRFLFNSFFCHIIGFGLTLFIYAWGWSELYPPLTIGLVLFFLVTFCIAFILGFRIAPLFRYRKIEVDKKNTRILLFVYVAYCLEFAYAKGIPIFLVFTGADYSYQDFGIPTFHVFIQTFTPFYALYVFHQWLEKPQNVLLQQFFLFLLPSILIVSRGAVIMTCVGCLILYLKKREFINVKKMVSIFLFLGITLYLFGFIGFVRSFKDNEDELLRVAKATDSFQESIVPREYFWFYLYASSPVANFQEAVNTQKHPQYRVFNYLAKELLPDFISKRVVSLNDDTDAQQRMNYSIAPFLTVGTAYFDSYIRMGWFGPIFTFLFYMTLSVVYILLLSIYQPARKYATIGLVVLCTMSLFNVFDNMISFTGLSFQLIYPFVLSFIDRLRFV